MFRQKFFYYRPQTKSWRKVMFLHVSDCSQGVVLSPCSPGIRPPSNGTDPPGTRRPLDQIPFSEPSSLPQKRMVGNPTGMLCCFSAVFVVRNNRINVPKYFSLNSVTKIFIIERIYLNLHTCYVRDQNVTTEPIRHR